MALSLLLPAFFIVGAFFILPLFDAFLRSLTDPTVGLQNYRWLVETPSNWPVFGRTFGTSAVVTLVCLLLAYPYAYLMTIVSDRVRLLLTTFILLPLWTSILVRTIAWMVLLQDSGPINDFLEWTGVGRQDLIRTSFGVGIGMVQVLLPFLVLPLYSALSKIDLRLLQAARSLGASPFIAFVQIYLPLSRAGILAGSITVFILGLGFYIIPSLLGSPKEMMASSLIQQQVSNFLMWGHGGALGVVLLVSTVLALLVATRLSRGGLFANIAGGQ